MMYISNESNTPIYIQISTIIEEQILNGVFKENTQIISTNELSAILKVNPNTVLKGINLLVEEKTLYKKRGIGMFVSEGALEIIVNKRSDSLKTSSIRSLIDEAKKIGLSEEELIEEIRKGFK